ncbi:MAG: UDPGP type 1 family protein [bacterium]|nr:UDPGP type 1 family protein [bacterium]
MPGTTSATPKLEDLRVRLSEIQQGHLLRFADDLAPAELEALCAQIAALDLESVPALVREYVHSKPSFDPGSATIAPPPGYMRGGDWDIERFRSAGEQLLREGKVAAFTVAGGQGSRLGYDGPKGCYPGGAVTGKPLFACLADWIHSAQDRYGATVPWYIMTSPLNHEATVAFFKQHDHFGLSPDNIMFFAQGVLPSFDMATGKILLASKGTVATNPDGHGGSLRALAHSGALEDMKRRGVEHISYVQIDNPLARVVDPVFIGLHAAAPNSSGEMSTKVVAKTEPGEKVGVVCTIDGKPGVIEYSDLPEATAAQRNPDGTLTLRAGNIALHMLSRSFVERITSGDLSLPYHRAEKKVPCIDPETGQSVDPSEPNAVKLEMFVFDAIPLCRNSIVYEVERADEFAPIKNAEGNDSIESSARIQTERAASWLDARGVKVPRKSDGSSDCVLEISPRTATRPEELRPESIEPIRSGEKRAI